MNLSKNVEQLFFQQFLQFFEVCSRGNLSEVCSNVLEEISLFTISRFFLVFFEKNCNNFFFSHFFNF